MNEMLRDFTTTEPAVRKRLRLLILILIGLAFAILSLLACQEGLIDRLLGRVVRYKTQFSVDEVRDIQEVIGVTVPRSATIDWARFHHCRDSDITIRFQVPIKDACELRHWAETVGTAELNFDSSELVAYPEAEETAPLVEWAYQLDSGRQICFCKASNGLVAVYVDYAPVESSRISGVERIFQ